MLKRTTYFFNTPSCAFTNKQTGFKQGMKFCRWSISISFKHLVWELVSMTTLLPTLV